MAKLLLAGGVHEVGRKLLEARPDIEVEILNPPTEAGVAERIGEVEAIVMRTAAVRVGREMIAKAKRLKVISRHGVGYDNIDAEAMTEAGIPLAVAGEANSVSVAEHAFALMLDVAKRIRTHDREMRAGNYDVRFQMKTFDLAGRTLLIVGFGRIGTRVARRAEAFEMDVIVADPFVPRRAIEGHGYRYVADFRDALGDADIVTAHMPASFDGRPVFGAGEFAAMKPDAVFINCARGSLVDEVALIGSLSKGHLGGAGLDVTREEPPPADHPLLSMPQVALSPHCAGTSKEAMERMSQACVQNAIDAIDGKLDPKFLVNPEVIQAG